MTKTRVSVFGAGAWGTTLSILLAENGHPVKLWVFENELAKEINEIRENKTYLPGFQLPPQIEITADIAFAAKDAEAVFLVVPAQFIRGVLKKIPPFSSRPIIVSAAKGIEIDSLKRPSQIIKEITNINAAVLSGPNLAQEIANGKPAASVVACEDSAAAKNVQTILMSDRFRIYTSDDSVGVELGGALKNIIAISAGIADGLNLGENARAGLMVRGISEISRLGCSLGGKEKTFFGLSGIGDLILTCSSASSRNHRVGYELAQGKKIDEIKNGTRQVAEGISTCQAVNKLLKKKEIEMPIIKETYAVLFENKDPYTAMIDLLTRKAKSED